MIIRVVHIPVHLLAIAASRASCLPKHDNNHCSLAAACQSKLHSYLLVLCTRNRKGFRKCNLLAGLSCTETSIRLQGVSSMALGIHYGIRLQMLCWVVQCHEASWWLTTDLAWTLPDAHFKRLTSAVVPNWRLARVPGRTT